MNTLNLSRSYKSENNSYFCHLFISYSGPSINDYSKVIIDHWYNVLNNEKLHQMHFCQLYADIRQYAHFLINTEHKQIF